MLGGYSQSGDPLGEVEDPLEVGDDVDLEPVGRHPMGLRGDELAQVDEGIIRFLMMQQESLAGSIELDESDYRPGDSVAILEGPFAGLSGVYQMKKDADRVELLLSLMGRKLPVMMHLDQLGGVA